MGGGEHGFLSKLAIYAQSAKNVKLAIRGVI